MQVDQRQDECSPVQSTNVVGNGLFYPFKTRLTAAEYPNALDCDRGAEDAVARVGRQVEVIECQLIGIPHEAKIPARRPLVGC